MILNNCKIYIKLYNKINKIKKNNKNFYLNQMKYMDILIYY